MKLSMSLLAWYLRSHHPICHIEDDSLCIEGMRFVMDDVSAMQPEFIYFGNAAYFFAARQYSGAYIAANRHSILIFMESEYNELLNGCLSAFDYFNRWEASLLEAAGKNAPLTEFLKIGEAVLTNPLVIGNLDRSFWVATDPAGHKTDPLWNEAARGIGLAHPAMYAPYYTTSGDKIRELSETPVLVKNVYDGGAPVMMLYLPQEMELVGSLAILQEHPELTEQNRQLAPIFARYCIKAAEFTSDSGAIQSGTSIFRKLLEGRQTGELNLSRLSQLLPPPPWRLLALRMNFRTDQLAIRALMAQLRQNPCCFLPLQIDDECYALTAERDMPRLGRFSGARIGASMPFSQPERLPIRCQQAHFALLQADGEEAALCEDYACDYLLCMFRGEKLTASLLHPALETLERYDRDNHTQLRKTLSVYLHYERNQQLSAQALHIHPNTLRYRLQRMMELTGLTLENPRELKYLRLSDWLS